MRVRHTYGFKRAVCAKVGIVCVHECVGGKACGWVGGL